MLSELSLNTKFSDSSYEFRRDIKPKHAQYAIHSVIKPDESPLNSWFRQQGASKTNLNISNPKTKLPKLNGRRSSKKSGEHNNMLRSNTLHSFKEAEEEEDRGYSPPSAPNSFYLKCINDVINTNQPQNLDLYEPRELRYVQSIPFFKYITYGTGRSLNTVWKIDRCNV